MQTSESIEELGLELQALANKVFPSTPAKISTGCSKAGFSKHSMCDGKDNWEPQNQLRASRNSMIELVSWNNMRNSTLLPLSPEERPDIQIMVVEDTTNQRVCSYTFQEGANYL